MKFIGSPNIVLRKKLSLPRITFRVNGRDLCESKRVLFHAEFKVLQRFMESKFDNGPAAPTGNAVLNTQNFM